jgi:hypothetical protein
VKSEVRNPEPLGDLGVLGGSTRASGARLQGEFLPGAVEPSDKVTEEIAPKKYLGALVTDDRQFDVTSGNRI